MPELMTAKECIIASGLDWTIEAVPVQIDNENTDYQAIRRTDTKKVLHIAKSRYRPIQNTEVFSIFDNIVQSGYAKYESAKSWKEGRIIFVDLKLPEMPDQEILKGDSITFRLRIITSHDGSVPFVITPNVIRLICQNQLRGYIRETERKISVRHTLYAQTRIQVKAQSTLKPYIEYFQVFTAKMQALAKQQMTELELDSFLCQLFGADENKKNNSNQLNSKIETIKVLTQTGIGTNIDGVKGTKWGIYNAVTEYLDHRSRSKEREFNSFMGSNSHIREKAFSLLTS